MPALLRRKARDFRKFFYIAASILRSGNQDAYYVALIKAAVLFLAPVNWLLYFLETIFIRRRDTGCEAPVVFVTGIQRSGTTLISQVIADAFPFFPLGNIGSVFSRSSFFIHRLGKRFFVKKSCRRFTNYYGFSAGIWSVGDCYEVWDRWLGSDHYAAPEVISRKNRHAIRNYFSNATKIYRLPVITKNNRNVLCLSLLQELFPRAFFVVTRRDPIEVILSTLEGSRQFFGNSRLLWGLKPFNNFDETDYVDRLEAACFQQVYLEKKIEEQLSRIGQDRYHVIDYESFCQHPEKTLKALADRFKTAIPVPAADIRFDYPAFPVQRASVGDDLRGRVRSLYEQAVRSVNSVTPVR